MGLDRPVDRANQSRVGLCAVYAAADHPSLLLDLVVATERDLDASKDEPVETDTRQRIPTWEAAPSPHYCYYWVILVTKTRWTGATLEVPWKAA